jgi:hypothetical protein
MKIYGSNPKLGLEPILKQDEFFKRWLVMEGGTGNSLPVLRSNKR